MGKPKSKQAEMMSVARMVENVCERVLAMADPEREYVVRKMYEGLAAINEDSIKRHDAEKTAATANGPRGVA